MKYWIGVASRNHVQRGVADGFAQLCHGKQNPLTRMARGDWLVYYSPRSKIQDGAAVQAFTAIGQLVDDEVYQFRMSETFMPFRRRVNYTPCAETSIKPLLPRLSFVKDLQHWGYQFRFGHFEISEGDFRTIAWAMQIEFVEGDFAIEAAKFRVQL